MSGRPRKIPGTQPYRSLQAADGIVQGAGAPNPPATDNLCRNAQYEELRESLSGCRGHPRPHGGGGFRGPGRRLADCGGSGWRICRRNHCRRRDRTVGSSSRILRVSTAVLCGASLRPCSLGDPTGASLLLPCPGGLSLLLFSGPAGGLFRTAIFRTAISLFSPAVRRMIQGRISLFWVTPFVEARL